MAMLFPTYRDLIKSINSTSEDGKPIIESRYSVVVAAAKRARQIIAGAEPYATAKCSKPLSIAVEEVYQGKVKIVGDEEEE